MSGPRIFFSVGEPSGDLHASNLIHALRRRNPDIICEGYGGDLMAAAGCQLHFPLCNFPLVGIVQVVKHIPYFQKILDRAVRHWHKQRPDAVLLVDYPGFNWWVARRAHEMGIPVWYFVPPQIWGWACWRIRKMKKYVDRVLCALPFEERWYRRRGVDAPYIGHPYFDALAQQRLDDAFLQQQRAAGGTIVAMLPGSRNQELSSNLKFQLEAAETIHRRRPETRFMIACFKEHQAERVRLATQKCKAPVEVHVGRTAEIIHLAHSCLAVSGSVSLELLYACKPTVTQYCAAWPLVMTYHVMRRVPYISLINLLADRPLLPEFVTSRSPATPMADHIVTWLEQEETYAGVCEEMRQLRDRVARPGACERAAELLLKTLGAVDLRRAS